MLDSNILDRLDADLEALSELSNRRDLRPMVSSVQLAELAAIPDPVRRERLLGMAAALCSSVASPRSAPSAAEGALGGGAAGHRHEATNDDLIVEAARSRCGLLVSDDRRLLERATASGVRAMDFDRFASRVLFARASR